MKIYYLRAFLITFLISLAAPAVAESSSHDDIIALRQALSELRNDYENRIKDLERRLTLAEAKTETTLEIAEEAALAPVVTSRSANDFNPLLAWYWWVPLAPVTMTMITQCPVSVCLMKPAR